MKNDSKLMKALIGAVVSAALLTTPLVASATLFQVQITGTGAFSGVSYNSGVLNSNLISSGTLFSSGNFTYDVSVNNSPGGSNNSFIDSTFGAYNLGTQAGTVTILASATGYTSGTAGSNANLYSSIGGTANNASVTAQTWVNGANVLNGMGSDFTLQGPFSSASFSNDATTAFIASNPFSMTQQIILNVASRGSTTGDFHSSIPEPGSLALIGLGLLAAGALRRRQV